MEGRVVPKDARSRFVFREEPQNPLQKRRKSQVEGSHLAAALKAFTPVSVLRNLTWQSRGTI